MYSESSHQSPPPCSSDDDSFVRVRGVGDTGGVLMTSSSSGSNTNNNSNSGGGGSGGRTYGHGGLLSTQRASLSSNICVYSSGGNSIGGMSPIQYQPRFKQQQLNQSQQYQMYPQKMITRDAIDMCQTSFGIGSHSSGHQQQHSGYVNSNRIHSSSYEQQHSRMQHQQHIQSEYTCSPQHLASLAKLTHQRKRTRSLLLLAGVAFVGMIVFDGLLQLSYVADDEDERVSSDRGTSGGGGGVDGGDMGGRLRTNERALVGSVASVELHRPEKKGIMRSVGAFLEKEQNDSVPRHRSFDQEGGADTATGSSLYDNSGMNVLSLPSSSQQQPPRRRLHTLPLLPKHALQHRQRRELIESQQQIPLHLREGQDDEQYFEGVHRRRRLYPMATTTNVVEGEEMMKIVDARMMHRRIEDISHAAEEEVDEATLYETGALYQGYGTHYLDLWVGTPPQRQTVIIDTGSSVTAFPCSGCESCGVNPATGVQYHLDADFNKSGSSTYEESSCKAGVSGEAGVPCPLGMCTRLELTDTTSPQICKLAVSYAEGSTWTAVEASDVVYPAGPHEEALDSKESRLERGVGVGGFDWMDFRLKFGCQTKVRDGMCF